MIPRIKSIQPPIRFTTLNKICKVLDCVPGDILDYQPDPEGAEVEEDIFSE